MAKCSIIIPCYNSGDWLNQTLNSAINQDTDDFDIIIVNDGSTDPVTNRIFEEIDHPRVKKISTENQGLAEARNTGIRASDADYILPLDADDWIEPTFLRKAIVIMESQPNTGIVGCDVSLFGEESGTWYIDYSFPEILTGPQIVATSLFSKDDWETVGGYRADMIYGWEDYDFWLSILKTGKEFRKIPEVLFHYRRTKGSMAGLDRSKMIYSFKKIFEHHQDLYLQNPEIIFDAIIDSKPYRTELASKEVFQMFAPPESDATKSATSILEQSYKHGLWSKIDFTFQLPEDSDHSMRFDPGSSVGIYEISTIRITNPVTGELVKLINSSDNFESLQLSGNAKRIKSDSYLTLLSTGEDPCFYIPADFFGKSDTPVKIEIWTRFTPNLKILEEDSAIFPESSESQKIQDLEKTVQFLKEQEQLLKYQEISIREEMQNLRNEKSLIHSELNNIQGTAKSLQADLKLLQHELSLMSESRDHYLNLCKKHGLE